MSAGSPFPFGMVAHNRPTSSVEAPRGPRAGSARTFRCEVLDARTGEPVPGARATVAEPPAPAASLDRSPSVMARSGSTDARGQVSLVAPSAPRWWLLVDHPAFLPELVEIRDATTEAHVHLSQASSVHGRVLDESGRPLAGVRVRAYCPAEVDIGEAVSGVDGCFHLTGIRHGYWIVVADPGGGTAQDDLGAAVLAIGRGEKVSAELRMARQRAQAG